MLKIQDRRCQFCNWLNKEVKSEFKCNNCGRTNTENVIEEVEEVEEVQDIEEVVNSNWLEEVDEIKGIGPETFEDIKRRYSAKEDLINDLKEDKVGFRNDVVKKLKLYFKI